MARYCLPCQRESMRKSRLIAGPVSEIERRKGIARSTLHVAIRRGKLSKGPCAVCSAANVHGHHPDYSKPLEVVWLCPVHHRVVHLNNSGTF